MPPLLVNALQRIVHVELDRVHCLAEAGYLAHLQFNVGIEHAVAEHTALGQEGAVCVQGFQRLIQAVAHGGHQLVFFGW